MTGRILNFPVIPRATALPPAPEVICIDDEHAASRLARIVRNALVDAESHGIGLEAMRTLLINALQYIDAKIAARSLND